MMERTVTPQNMTNLPVKASSLGELHSEEVRMMQRWSANYFAEGRREAPTIHIVVLEKTAKIIVILRRRPPQGCNYMGSAIGDEERGDMLGDVCAKNGIGLHPHVMGPEAELLGSIIASRIVLSLRGLALVGRIAVSQESTEEKTEDLCVDTMHNTLLHVPLRFARVVVSSPLLEDCWRSAESPRTYRSAEIPSSKNTSARMFAGHDNHASHYDGRLSALSMYHGAHRDWSLASFLSPERSARRSVSCDALQYTGGIISPLGLLEDVTSSVEDVLMCRQRSEIINQNSFDCLVALPGRDDISQGKFVRKILLSNEKRGGRSHASIKKFQEADVTDRPAARFEQRDFEGAVEGDKKRMPLEDRRARLRRLLELDDGKLKGELHISGKCKGNARRLAASLGKMAK